MGRHRGRAHKPVTAANGYLYVLADDVAGTDISYYSINADGTLSVRQRSAESMVAPHPRGVAAFYEGRLYVSGNCVVVSGKCTGVGAGTESGGQQALTRIGHYLKLFHTQVDTLPAQLVGNSVAELRFQTAGSSNPVLAWRKSFGRSPSLRFTTCRR